MLASGNQDPQRGPNAVVASREVQLVRLQRQDRGSDSVCVEWVGLTGTAVGPGVHSSGLDHLIALVEEFVGDLRKIAALI